MMHEQVYVAYGQKTRIRPFFRSDVDRWLEWPDHPDPLFAAYNPRRMPPWLRDVWYRDLVERQRQQPYAVDDLDGLMIGRIFLRHVRPTEGASILGIDLRPDRLGCGFGSDALRAFLRYYFSILGFRKVFLTVASYNLRAKRTYQRCGFQVIGYHWDRHDVRAAALLRRPDYRALAEAFRQTRHGLEARFEDMVLTAERFRAVWGEDQHFPPSSPSPSLAGP